MDDQRSSRRRLLAVSASAVAALAGCSGSTSTETPPDSATATSSATSSATATGTPSATGTATETPTRTPVERKREPELIKRTIIELINRHREEINKDIEPLNGDSSLADGLERMAQKYSERLAEAQTLVHDLGGQTIQQRYTNNGYGGCRVPSADGSRLLPFSVLEVLARVDTYARLEEAIARAAVDTWKATYSTNRSLTLGDVRAIGIGVTLVPYRDEAYVVVNLCN